MPAADDTPPSLEDALAAHPRCQRVQGVLFTHLEHVPSGEQIHIGFRCFAAEAAPPLRDAIARGDLGAVLGLPPALDADGSPGLSLVRLDIAHIPSGALVGVQPVAYTDYVPSPAAPALILEGAEAAAWADQLRALDQQA